MISGVAVHNNLCNSDAMLAEIAYRQLQGIELSSTKLPVGKCIQLLVAGPMLYDGSEGHFKKEDIKGRLTEVKQFMKHPTAAKVVEVRNPILPIAFKRY